MMMPGDLSRPRKRPWLDWLTLAAIAAAGLGLRLYGIRFGLPYLYHFDETVYTGAALNLGAGTLGVQMNPTGFVNILFGEYALFFITGKLLGWFADAASFGASYHADPSQFLLLARITSALFGTGAVLAVYFMGWGWKRQQERLFAALLLAVAFLHVRQSHFGVPDACAAFFVTIAAAFGVQAQRTGRPAFLWAGAFSAAYAVTVKWSVWPVFLPLGLAAYFFFRQPAERAAAQPPAARTALLTAAAALAGFLLGGFQILLAPAAYLDYARQELQAGAAGGFWIWQVDTLPGWLFYLKVLVQGLGILLAVLMAAGSIYSLAQAVQTRSKPALIVLSFPVVYFLLMGATRHYFARYLLPALPFGALFAASLLPPARAWLENRWNRAGGAVFAALVLAVVAQPAAASLRFGYLLGQEDTRTAAARWIEANLPAGARIAVDAPYLGPPLSTAEEPVKDAARTYQVRDFLGQSGLSARDLNWYLQESYDYLIASSFIYNIPLSDPAGNAPRAQFYQSLGDRLELIRVFSPSANGVEPVFVFDEMYGPFVSLWDRDRPGPVLKIYRVPEKRTGQPLPGAQP